MAFGVPDTVLARATGCDPSLVLSVEAEELREGTGAATAGLDRLRIRLDHPCPVQDVFVVRKRFRPLRDGRHRHGAEDPEHWAYWCREPLAYGSGVLPAGPGLRAPRSFGVLDSTIYLEDAGGEAVESRIAARQLGTWQSTATTPDVAWLSGHQLVQRVEASELDWSIVASDGRAESLWGARHGLLDRLASVPHVLSHGDFHPGNLRLVASDTVVLDWGTFGLAPAGADLAHLALGAQRDLAAEYLVGLSGRFDEEAVDFAYRATLVLVGASRVHWMLSNGKAIPDGYVDFLWNNRPRSL